MKQSALENLEDIYQLSPMQQGILFHALYAPESGAYFEQSLFTIRGNLDPKAFSRAWQGVIDRHSILRTSFLWEELDQPQQIVHRQVALPLVQDDWSLRSPAEQEQLLQSYILQTR